MLTAQQARFTKLNRITDDIQDVLESINFQITNAVKYGTDSVIAFIDDKHLTSKGHLNLMKELKNKGYTAKWSEAYSNGVFISWELPTSLIDNFRNIFIKKDS
jgi:formyltetrahydrofolate synthetase